MNATNEWNYLTSPNYPDDYFNEASCSWLLHSTERFVVLEILDFEIEEEFDYMTIYDGNNSNSPTIAILTGSAIHSTYFSSGTDMYITFTSDAAVTEKGFELRLYQNTYFC